MQKVGVIGSARSCTMGANWRPEKTLVLTLPGNACVAFEQLI